MKKTLIAMIVYQTRKFTKLFFLGIFLCAFINVRVTVSNAAENNFSIPDDHYHEMDDFLKDYINENIPKDSLWVDCETKTNFFQISNNNKKNDMSDKVNGMAYTFTRIEEGESAYYTVIDFYFNQKIKTSKNDLLEIPMNDYLLAYDGATKGQLLVKNKIDQEWTISKDLVVYLNVPHISVYGAEIHNNQNFSRVILSFKSMRNPNSIENSPSYIIQYTHQRDIIWPFVIFCLIIIFFVTNIIFLFFRKIRNRTE